MPQPRLLPLSLAAFAAALLYVAPVRAHDGKHPHNHDDYEAPATPAPKSIRLTLNADGGVNPWNHLDFHNDPNAFQFAIVSDRTGGARPGIFEDAIHKLNLLQPEFVMSVGDLIEGYSHDPAVVNAQWDEFQGFIRELQMPFFYLPGNHDNSNATMVKIWRERFGAMHYSFVYRDVLFICLNSQGPGDGTYAIDPAQSQWVRDTLAAHTDVRWTLVFLHVPLWDYDAKRGWPAVEAALHGRPHTVFAGHYHSYLKSERKDANYYILASTGGASDMRGPSYGEFDQVAWVTMTNQGPVIANLLLDGIKRDDIYTPATKSFVEPLAARGFTADVIWAKDGRASSSQVNLLSANPTAVPVDIVFKLEPAAGLTATLNQGLERTPDGRYAFTLQPQASRAFVVDIGGDIPTHPQQARTIGQLSWEARLQPAGAEPLHLTESTQLAVVPRLTAPTVGRALVIDGDISDWPATSIYDVKEPAIRESSGWNGAADCAFRVGFAHDDANLYLSVIVHDDDVIAQADNPPWKQDGIEVRLDFRAPAIQRLGRQSERGLVFIGSSPAPGDGRARNYLYDPKSLPEGTQISCRHTPDGYIFEAAIPRASLAVTHGTQWPEEGFRFNVAVNDRDADNKQAQIWWQPDWRTPANIPGAGTVFLK